MAEDRILNENVGNFAVEKITGFEGVVTGFCQHMTGCDQYLVTPKCGADGKYPEAHWFDVNRLNFTDDVKVTLNTSVDNGCDQSAPSNY